MWVKPKIMSRIGMVWKNKKSVTGIVETIARTYKVKERQEKKFPIEGDMKSLYLRRLCVPGFNLSVQFKL